MRLSRRNDDIIPSMENWLYRNGSHQVRGNARRPFRHARRVQKLANSATAHSSLLPDHYFIWDPAEPVATRPLGWNRNGDLSYYVFDGNKNDSEVIVSDGTLAAHYEYAPFGAVILQRGESAAANPFRFSSEYADDELGCVYYNYRHYEPVTGRWMSRDPIEEKGGENLYIACNNDLRSQVDCLGRNPAAALALGASIARAISALSLVAIVVSQNSLVSESLSQALNEAVASLESCLESARQLVQETSGMISGVLDDIERLRKQACDELNDVVQKTKKQVGSFHPAKCNCLMNCYELTMRKNAWFAEGVARAQRDVLCWDCGDGNHQSQQADVWQHFGNCFSIWLVKCSWR